jgi:hypothetical protein
MYTSFGCGPIIGESPTFTTTIDLLSSGSTLDIKLQPSP